MAGVRPGQPCRARSNASASRMLSKNGTVCRPIIAGLQIDVMGLVFSKATQLYDLQASYFMRITLEKYRNRSRLKANTKVKYDEEIFGYKKND